MTKLELNFTEKEDQMCGCDDVGLECDSVGLEYVFEPYYWPLHKTILQSITFVIFSFHLPFFLIYILLLQGNAFRILSKGVTNVSG